MKLPSKIALVTGSSRGIGRGIAAKLAQEGAFVWVNFRSNEDEANALVREIEDAGGQAAIVQGDVAELSDHAKIFAPIVAAGKGLDILVNNAGWGEFVDFSTADAEHFDKQFNLNVRGLFFLTQRALTVLNDNGRIINISSIGSRGFSGAGAAYAGTKAAVNAFTSAWSKDLGARKITVNAISPGLVVTDLARESFSTDDIERMSNGAPLGRAGTVEDIADIAAFLASDDARWITGREIVADGGTI